MKKIIDYLNENDNNPLFINGDSLKILSKLPEESIDCVITSPPYYRKREYLSGGIGLESSYVEYINNLLIITKQIHRILKPTGSFWLNLGDSYLSKQLLNLPYRVAIRMQDEQGWILRNTIIWDKVKGAMSNSKDSLPSEYEPLFHFVKNKDSYYYDIDSVRKKPGTATIKNGTIISATGVRGINYKRKIELSTELNKEQKRNAIEALENVLAQIKNGELSDFRMVIKGAGQRVTNGNSLSLSGRAKELEEKGYYFLFYNPKGSPISDVWQIIPEDSQGRKLHFSPFPEDLVKTPIVLTCPSDGIVLDPFVGTGTTCYVASLFKRKSIGIDISKEYIEIAKDSCKNKKL